ncbi:MAG: ACT domain-containing protein, partial [Deltaproteobacteria bacterium]|nr:ACT domain-containing protein [Deltaproteobacteria bacterium]
VHTVDTHTGFALQRPCRLRAGLVQDAEPERTRVARACERPLVLALAILFHDLGKGLGGDHSQRGVELVRAYAARLGLDPGDAADVEWMVKDHLVMSLMSQRRDLEDEAMIREFAATARTVERLEMLYVLTYVDMASVSAENWTQWKAGLLFLLTDKARATLRGEGPAALDDTEHAKSLTARRERLAAAVTDLLREEARKAPASDEASLSLGRRAAELSAAFAGGAPERYLAVVRSADAARHLKLWLSAKESGFAAELVHAPTGGSVLTLVASDQPGLLALFSAALAASGIDVLAAEVNSFDDGMAVDLFSVREPGGGAVDRGRWELARADLSRLLNGAESPSALVQRKLRRATWAQSTAPAVATKVRIDNLSSLRCTVVDVSAQDRPGLLHAIAQALHAAEVSIELARVATEGNKAIDAFYLRDLRHDGAKLTDPARLVELEAAVRAAIDSLPLA